MKLHLQAPSGENTVTGYGEGYVEINKQRFHAGLILLPDRIVEGWAGGGFEALVADDFGAVVEQRPEIVLIGTGARLRHPAPPLLRPLIEARVGFEVMDFGAACRTYNFLMAEGRRVAAALMFD